MFFKPPHPSHLQRPRFSLWLVAWMALICALPLTAKTAGDGFALADSKASDSESSGRAYQEPRFYIEKLVVEGSVRASEDLILAETRLESGRVYSERELRRGLENLNRLPFVLDSAMALRRGSERGRYVLVLQVVETKAFFYSNDYTHAELSLPVRLDRGELTEQASTSSQLTGWRFFVGPYTVFSAAIGNESRFQAGWTRYNLADRGIVLSLDLSHQGCCSVDFQPLGLDPGFNVWRVEGDRQQAQLTLGIPLEAQQSLTLRASVGLSEGGVRASAFESREETLGDDEFGENVSEQTFDDRRNVSLGLTWRQDTTDDPLLPSRGTVLSAGLDFRQWSAELRGREAAVDGEGRLGRVVVGAARYWSLNRRQSVAVHGRLAFGTSDSRDLNEEDSVLREDGELWESTLALQHSLALWNSKMQRRFGDLRWENTVSWSRDEGAVRRSGFGPVEQWRFQSAVIFRNAWGIMRVGLTYLEWSELA